MIGISTFYYVELYEIESFKTEEVMSKCIVVSGDNNGLTSGDTYLGKFLLVC